MVWRVVGLVVAISVGIGELSQTEAAEFRWTNTTSSNAWFEQVSNWQLVPNTGSGTAPPGASDNALFDQSATYNVSWDSLTGHRTNAALNLTAGNVTFLSTSSGPYTYTLTGQATIRTGTLNIGSSATNRHNLTTQGSLNVRQSGTLNIRFGSHVTVGTLQLGSETPGTIVVDGTGSTLASSGVSHSIGLNGGSGTLTFQNNAIGNFTGNLRLADSIVANSTASLSVLTGASLTVNSLAIGTGGLSGQSGVINLQNHNSAITQTGAAQFTLGAAANSPGTVNIGTSNGSSTTILTTGSGSITINPTGALNIGGDLTTRRGTFNANGHLTINGGTLTRGSFGFFNLAPGRNVSASNNAILTFTGGYNIGGGSTFTIQSGARINTTGHLDIGAGPGDGTLVLNGGRIDVEAGTFSMIGSASGTGTLTMDGNSRATFAGSVNLGHSGAGSAGQVLLQALSRLSATSLYIGGSSATAGGTGTASITSAARLTLSDTLRIWNSGQLHVTGTNSRIVTPVLEIIGGAFTRNDNTAVAISDTLPAFEPSNLFFVGLSTGTGTMHITAGGTFSDQGNAFLASDVGSTAIVSVTGPGSLWQTTGSIFLGGDAATSRGTANVTISNGGRIQAQGHFYIHGLSTLNMSGGAELDVGTFRRMGTFNFNDGTLTVRGGGFRSSPAPAPFTLNGASPADLPTLIMRNNAFTQNLTTLTVGSTRRAAVEVLAGAVLTTTGQDINDIGKQPGSQGIMAISGTGSRWNNAGSLMVGRAGAGSMTIENAGLVEVTGSAWIGATPGGLGSVAVRGAGSGWTVGQILTVGGGDVIANNPTGGDGALQIESAGMVQSHAGVLGHTENSSGHVLVTGLNSNWSTTAELIVGDQGTGLLDVQSNGRVSVGTSLQIGSQGQVNLTGGTITAAGLEIAGGELVRTAGTALLISDALIFTPPSFDVGRDGGSGVVSIIDGGRLNNASAASIGIGAGSNGAVTVSGPGSQWNNNGAVYVGGDFSGAAGSGVITVANDGSLNLGNTLLVWDDGLVQLDGGTITAQSLDLRGGGRVIYSSGDDNTLTTAHLMIDVAGGSLIDVADSELIVTTTPLAQIHAYVASGYAGGAWNGKGISSSDAASQSGRAIGVAPTGSTRVAFTWGGDASLDGSVTIADLGILAANWQQSSRFWHQGDFNYDGQVNIADLGILAGNWQKGAASPGMGFDEALAMFDVFDGVVIPEPAGLSLLSLAGLALLRRRRS
jgi:autotransporter family porin